MRLFIGLPFPHQARRDFLWLQKRLERHAVKGNFTAVENFHLTLVFLGEVEEQRLPLIFSALEEADLPPLELVFNRLDVFAGGIWHLVPAPCPALMSGQSRLARELRRRGFELEEHPFVPHLTLGRKIVLREGYVPRSPLHRPISARSEGARLFLSHRVEGALRYDILSMRHI